MDKIFRCSFKQHSQRIPSHGSTMLKVQSPPSHLVNEANAVSANFMCYLSLHVSLCSLVDKISVYTSVKWLIFRTFISSVVTSWLQLKATDLKCVLTIWRWQVRASSYNSNKLTNQMQQFHKFITWRLCVAWHVSGAFTPIIRSLRLH